MSEVIPPPSENDKPINEPLSTRLDPGQRATFTYEPRQQTTPGFVVPIVAISKSPESSYTIWFDNRKVFGPSSVPPTDIDDLGVTFTPAFEFEDKLRVQVENISENTTRTYTVQPVGYERVSEGGDE